MPRGVKAGLKEGGGSISGYFRKIFQEKPELLRTRSNEELLARWEADHGKPADDRIKQNLSNVKSLMRKKKRKQSRKSTLAAEVNGVKPVVVRPVAPRSLETLEEHIDDCLTLAKHLDRERLANVIKLLRTARNQVVWAQGQ